MDSEKKKFIEYLNQSIKTNSFVRLKFGKYKGGDKEFENIFVTKISIKEGERLSFNFRYKTKDIVKNYEFPQGINLASEILGKDFFTATLFTAEKDFTLDYSKKRIPKLHIKKPSFSNSETPKHNREKSRFINPESVYLHSLGIITKDRIIKADMYDKYRQVDKFIETVDSLYRSSGLKEKEELKITDMGSGKSYITFAMYDYFANALNKKVLIKGIEQRDELIKLSNRIASENNFSGLTFEHGTIDTLKPEKSNIVVALHACDTATDDAIIKAIEAEAEIIILAPCCQKYVRKKMIIPEDLKGVFKYGIHEERLAVMLTDGLRALALEYSGYETKVFEFISAEHTARNTMITAVKKQDKTVKNEDKLNEIKILKNKFSIEDFYLDKKLLI